MNMKWDQRCGEPSVWQTLKEVIRPCEEVPRTKDYGTQLREFIAGADKRAEAARVEAQLARDAARLGRIKTHLEKTLDNTKQNLSFYQTVVQSHQNALREKESALEQLNTDPVAILSNTKYNFIP
jgi:chromosome segregation ATPase